MACGEWRERISAFADGETSPEDAARVREHLAACERCRNFERRMRSVDEGMGRLGGEVSPGFRDAVFARLEAEDLLPPREKASGFRLRYAAVPLAAAAALAIFLLFPREAVRDRVVPAPSTARVEPPAPAPAPKVSREVRPAAEPAGGSSAAPGSSSAEHRALSPDEKEMIALMDVLEDPSAFDGAGDTEEKNLELLAPPPGAGDAPDTVDSRRRGA